MIPVSEVAKGTAHSAIRKMFNLASRMSDVVSFTVGEPDFPTPANVVEAAARALRDGQTHYTPNAGILPLRAAIADAMARDSGLRFDPEREVIVTAGGMEALMLLMLAVLDRGDEVILSDPAWPNYLGHIRMAGGVAVSVPVHERNGFVFDPEEVRRAVGPRTKVLLINSPANPTGAVAGLEVLAALAALAIEKDLLVVSDEVYRHFLYDGAEFVSIAGLPGMGERTVIIDSFSKTYAMTGWRVGWAAGPAEVIGNMVKLHENASACVNSPAQFGAIEALAGPQEPLRDMLAEYAERRALLLDGLAGIGRLSCGRPKGAFYTFVNIRGSGLASEDFALRLLTERSVAVVPGSGFGRQGEGFIRMSYSTSKDKIREGLARIRTFLNQEAVHERP